MSEDLTRKLSQTDSEKLTLLLSTVQSITVRIDNVDLRLSRVEQTVDNTRSILQDVVADVLQLQEGQRALSTEFRSLRRDVDHRFDLIYDKLVEIERFDHDIHDRVTRLELNTNPPNSQT
ncbi:MAG TPA: hypothetical protein VGW58_18075 [Pyrinomonadaceae bacterium]|nr:hypothetical protein [Pyrinomonadaceae bacterium]